ncbi:hypothetical protein HanRHA438_Chr10g0452171 [Helianthus annuus]|nr:hypothetical protein HanRHA438_Chr10g0452171 [Helianthus annuus]
MCILLFYMLSDVKSIAYYYSSGSTRLTRFPTAMGCSLVSPTVLESLLGA